MPLPRNYTLNNSCSARDLSDNFVHDAFGLFLVSRTNSILFAGAIKEGAASGKLTNSASPGRRALTRWAKCPSNRHEAYVKLRERAESVSAAEGAIILAHFGQEYGVDGVHGRTPILRGPKLVVVSRALVSVLAARVARFEEGGASASVIQDDIPAAAVAVERYEEGVCAGRISAEAIGEEAAEGAEAEEAEAPRGVEAEMARATEPWAEQPAEEVLQRAPIAAPVEKARAAQGTEQEGKEAVSPPGEPNMSEMAETVLVLQATGLDVRSATKAETETAATGSRVQPTGPEEVQCEDIEPLVASLHDAVVDHSAVHRADESNSAERITHRDKAQRLPCSLSPTIPSSIGADVGLRESQGGAEVDDTLQTRPAAPVATVEVTAIEASASALTALGDGSKKSTGKLPLESTDPGMWGMEEEKTTGNGGKELTELATLTEEWGEATYAASRPPTPRTEETVEGSGAPERATAPDETVRTSATEMTAAENARSSASEDSLGSAAASEPSDNGDNAPWAAAAESCESLPVFADVSVQVIGMPHRYQRACITRSSFSAEPEGMLLLEVALIRA